MSAPVLSSETVASLRHRAEFPPPREVRALADSHEQLRALLRSAVGVIRHAADRARDGRAVADWLDDEANALTAALTPPPAADAAGRR